MGSFPETEIDPKQLYRKFLLSGCLKRPHLRIFEIDKLVGETTDIHFEKGQCRQKCARDDPER